MSTFVEEVAEHVRNFNRDLLALEGGHGDSQPLLQSLFRTAHNLKGAARAVDVTSIETLCHGIEDILAPARDGAKALDADAFRILFAAADTIEETGVRLRGREAEPAPAPPAPPVDAPAAAPAVPAAAPGAPAPSGGAPPI